MTDYTPTTDFSDKDTLPAGDSEKAILGADFDVEFTAIQVAVQTKYDSTNLASNAEAVAGTSSSVLMAPSRVQSWYDAAVQRKYKTALTSRNSTTTVSADPHLTGFSVEAGVYYQIEGFLVIDSASAVPDFDFYFSSNQTLQIDNLVANYADEAGSSTEGVATNSITSTELTIPITATDAEHVILKGVFLGHASNDATVSFQWAQNTSNATDVTLNAGSWVTLTKLG